MLRMADTHPMRAAPSQTVNPNQTEMLTMSHQSSCHSASLLLLENDNNEKFHIRLKDLRGRKNARQDLKMH
jgi:hypothetical protein